MCSVLFWDTNQWRELGCLQTSVYADCLPNSLTSASITDRLQSPGHILILTLRKVRETKRIRFGKIGICKMGVYTSAVTHGDIAWDLKDPAHNLTEFLYTVTFKEIEYPPLEPKKNPQRIRCPEWNKMCTFILKLKYTISTGWMNSNMTNLLLIK